MARKHTANQTSGGVHSRLATSIMTTPSRLPKQVEAIGPQILAALHQAAAQLTDRDERHGGEQKDDGQQQEQNNGLDPIALLQPHGQLLAERIDAQVDRRRRG